MRKFHAAAKNLDEFLVDGGGVLVAVGGDLGSVKIFVDEGVTAFVDGGKFVDDGAAAFVDGGKFVDDGAAALVGEGKLIDDAAAALVGEGKLIDDAAAAFVGGGKLADDGVAAFNLDNFNDIPFFSGFCVEICVGGCYTSGKGSPLLHDKEVKL